MAKSYSTFREKDCFFIALHGASGRVVKGRKFVDLRDIGEPSDLAARYDADGADEIVLLDIGATPDGRAHALAVVRGIRRRLTIPLTVGGGVRSIGDAEALLQSGVS